MKNILSEVEDTWKMPGITTSALIVLLSAIMQKIKKTKLIKKKQLLLFIDYMLEYRKIQKQSRKMCKNN